MSADDQKRTTTNRRLRIDSAAQASKGPAKRSLNLSLSADGHRRLNALALLKSTTASALVESWIAANTVGLMFYLRGDNPPTPSLRDQGDHPQIQKHTDPLSA